MFDADVGVKRKQKSLNNVVKAVEDGQHNDEERRPNGNSRDADAGEDGDEANLFSGEQVAPGDEADNVHGDVQGLTFMAAFVVGVLGVSYVWIVLVIGFLHVLCRKIGKCA